MYDNNEEQGTFSSAELRLMANSVPSSSFAEDTTESINARCEREMTARQLEAQRQIDKLVQFYREQEMEGGPEKCAYLRVAIDRKIAETREECRLHVSYMNDRRDKELERFTLWQQEQAPELYE